MSLINLITLLIVMILIIFGCNENVLSYKMTYFDKIQKYVKDSTTFLEISGLCLNSSLGIKRIEKKTNDNSLIIKIFVGYDKNNNDGNFHLEIPINNNIDTILYGNEKHPIWIKEE